MTDIVNNATIMVTADASGVEAGLRPAIDAAQNAERAIAGVGNGSQSSARAQQSLIRAIERTTIQMQAGSRAGSLYFEILGRRRGIDPNILRPYLEELRRIEQAQQQAGSSAEDAGAAIKGALGSALASLSIAGFLQQVVSAQREFDKLFASLKTAVGSVEAANEAFAALERFASSTPYSMQQAVEGFVKLRNMGLDPSERALRSYGNTAAAMGKDLDQMIEAVADAATGEFERLKEFGIKASQENGKVSLTFKGTTTTIANSAAEIEKYLMRLGEVDFASAMAERAATLDGAVSNFGDTWTATMRTISQGGIGQAARDGLIGFSAALEDLQHMLDAVSEAAGRQQGALSVASGIHITLTTIFEALTVVGLNVAYVFKQIGMGIGGAAAQATALAQGNWDQVKEIRRLMTADMARDRAEVDAQSAAILGAAEKARKAAAAAPGKQGATDVLAQYRIQREAERESDAAAKQREAQYRREAAALAALAGLSASFADDWKMLSTLYGKGAISLDQLTKAQADLLAKQPAMKAAAEQEAAALKARADFQDAYSKGLEATSGIYAKRVQDAQDEATRNEDLARTYGMTKTAIEQLELARLEEQMAQRATLGLTLDEIGTLEQMIDAKKRNAAAVAAMEQVDAAKKAAEEWKRASESIEQSLTDALLRGFESGSGFGKNFVETLKNMFSTLVLRPIISAVVNPVAGALTGALGLSGAASAATGAAGAAGAGVGASLGIGGMLAGIGGGAMQTAGALLTGQIGFGSTLSAGAAALGTGSMAGITAGLSSIVGVLGPIALGIGAAVKAFGRGPKEYNGNSSIEGSFGSDGLEAAQFAEWKKKGGWFSSSKTGRDRFDLSGEMSASLTSAYDAIKASSADFAEVLGLNAASIATRSQSIKIALGKDQATNEKAIAEFFAGVANTVAAELLPEIGKFQVQGEQASATLQRLAVNFAGVDQILLAMGTTSQVAFGAVGKDSIAARERLVALAGGIDALATQTTFFNDNFLSQAERIAIIQGPLNEQLAKLGFAGITTSEQFKEAAQGLVKSGALATESGAKTYAELLALGPQYKLVSDYLKEASETAAEAAATLAGNILRERGQLQDELDSLTMSSTDLLAKQRAALDESNRALFDQIQAVKAKTAAEVAATAAIEKARSDAEALLGGVDGAFSVLQRVVDRQKRALQEEIAVRTQSIQKIEALSQSLRSTLDGMTVQGREAEDRQAAQAQIEAALAIAKATGKLPKADDLKNALSIVSRDSAALFATQEDYLRDFYATRNGIEDLSGLSDKALTVEERSLKKLEDQVKQYDLMLEREQEQIDVLKGISVTGLSIEQALAALHGAILSAQANPVNSATSAISDAYKSALGRAPDSAGLDFWKDKAASGVSLDTIIGGIKGSPEAQVQKLYQEIFGRAADASGLQFWVKQMNGGMSAATVREALLGSDEKKLRGFAVGANYIPVDMPAMVHQGERIIPAADNRELMRRLASPEQGNEVLAAAVDRLTQTVARQEQIIANLQAAADGTQRNTKRLADGMEIVTDGYNAVRTKEEVPA